MLRLFLDVNVWVSHYLSATRRPDIVTAAESRHDGRPGAGRLNHPRHPAGLIIASPPRAVAWIVRGEPAPSGVLTTFATGDG